MALDLEGTNNLNQGIQCSGTNDKEGFTTPITDRDSKTGLIVSFSLRSRSDLAMDLHVNILCYNMETVEYINSEMCA
jgi:hypothetical protein